LSIPILYLLYQISPTSIVPYSHSRAFVTRAYIKLSKLS